MTGLDLETAARENIPILTVVKHDDIFSGYYRHMPLAIERYGAARQTGDYAGMATEPRAARRADRVRPASCGPGSSGPSQRSGAASPRSSMSSRPRPIDCRSRTRTPATELATPAAGPACHRSQSGLEEPEGTRPPGADQPQALPDGHAIRGEHGHAGRAAMETGQPRDAYGRPCRAAAPRRRRDGGSRRPARRASAAGQVATVGGIHDAQGPPTWTTWNAVRLQEHPEQVGEVVWIGGADGHPPHRRAPESGRQERQRRARHRHAAALATGRTWACAPSSPNTKLPLVQAHITASGWLGRSGPAPSSSRNGAPVSRSASISCVSTPTVVWMTGMSIAGLIRRLPRAE